MRHTLEKLASFIFGAVIGLGCGVLYRPAPRVLSKHSYPPMGYEIDGTKYTTPGDYALIVGGRVPHEVKVRRDVYDSVEVGSLWNP